MPFGRLLGIDGVRLFVADGVPVDWAREGFREARQRVEAGVPELFDVALPGGDGTAVVKAYTIDRWWPPFRRVLPGRALREGRGLQAVARLGLPAVPVLFWAEQRALGVVSLSVIATRRLDARPCHQVFRETGDVAVLEAVMDELAAMHRAGFAHGDAAARNWLWTRPRPTVIDLASWSRFSWFSQERDLERMLASLHWLTQGDEVPQRLLRRYVDSGLPRVKDEAALLVRAAQRAQAKRRA